MNRLDSFFFSLKDFTFSRRLTGQTIMYSFVGNELFTIHRKSKELGIIIPRDDLEAFCP